MKVELLFVAEEKGVIFYVKPTQNLQMDEPLSKMLKVLLRSKFCQKQKPQFMSLKRWKNMYMLESSKASYTLVRA